MLPCYVEDNNVEVKRGVKATPILYRARFDSLPLTLGGLASTRAQCSEYLTQRDCAVGMRHTDHRFIPGPLQDINLRR